MKRIILVLILGTIFFNLAGCGYTTRSMVDPNMKSIYVEPFINGVDIFTEQSQDTNFQTYYPQLERTVTNKIIDRFVFDGNLKVVKKDVADVVLKGTLIRYQRDPVRYADNDEDVTEYRISVIVDMALIDTKQHKELWREPNFVGDATYFVSGTNAKSESATVQAAVDDLATRVVERVVENW